MRVERLRRARVGPGFRPLCRMEIIRSSACSPCTTPSPKAPSLGLLGPDQRRCAWRGLELKQLLRGLLPLKSVSFRGSCPCLSRAPLGALSSHAGVPQGSVPLWPVHPRGLSSSGPCAQWGLDPLQSFTPRGLDTVLFIPLGLVLLPPEASGSSQHFPFPLGALGQEARPPVLSLFSVSPQILRVIFKKCTRP